MKCKHSVRNLLHRGTALGMMTTLLIGMTDMTVFATEASGEEVNATSIEDTSGGAETNEWLFDFGTANSSVQDGWTKITKEETYKYSEDTGYGWIGTNLPDSESDKLVDGALPVDFTGLENMARDRVRGSKEYEFAVDVPNGEYDVVVYGGYVDGTSTFKLPYTIEGTEIAAKEVGCFGSVEASVTVEDGQLNVVVRNAGKDTANAIISGLKVISKTMTQPGETKEPATTEEPTTTEEPVATEEPATTEEPVATEGPATTEEPVVTEGPATTEKPAETEKPVDPSADSNEWLFDFGTANSSVQDGWTKITKEETYKYSEDTGYGWIGTNLPDSESDKLVDGVLPVDFTGLENMARDRVRGSKEYEFAVDVPNGEYDVVVYGGYVDGTSTFKLPYTIEGTEIAAKEVGCFGSVEATVTVEDGQLNVVVRNAGKDTANAIISGLKVTSKMMTQPVETEKPAETKKPVDPSVDSDEWLFDFGTASSPVQDGWTKITKEETYKYSEDTGYGWIGTNLPDSESDKLVDGALPVDFTGLENMARDRVRGSKEYEFAVDVPNGEYDVVVYGGYVDGTSTFKLPYTIEGTEIAAKEIGCFGSVEATVTVEDGQLNVVVRNAGKDTANAIISGLKIIQKSVSPEKPEEPEDVHVAEVIEGEEPTVYYIESFNDAGALDNGLPVGWKTAGTIDASREAGARIIQTEGERTYYSVDASGNSPRYVGKVLTEVSKTGWIEYDFKFEEVTDEQWGLGLGFQSGSVNGRNPSIRGMIMPNGDVKFYNGSTNVTIANIKHKGWVHFAYEFNNNEKTFVVKITDAETGETIGKTTEAFAYNDAAGQVGTVVFNVSSNQSAKFGVDEIQVYGYITPFEFVPEITGGLEQTGKVELTETDTEYILKNDYCQVNIDKKKAVISKYYTKEGNEICGNNGDGSYLLNYTDSGHKGTSKQELALKNATGTIIRQTDDYCEISVKECRINKGDTDGNILPIDMDFRFVLTADAPGLYMYAILEEDYSEEDIANGRKFNFGQSRYSIKFDYDRLPYSVIQGGEIGGQLEKMPGPGDFNEDNEALKGVLDANGRLMDSTWILNDGSIFTKYNNLSYQYCNTMIGAFSDQGGLALLTPSRDWAGGGYSKQDIDVHGGTGNTFLVSWHLETGHNGTKGVDVEEGYRKVYGPVMWYATTDPSIESKEDAYDMAYAQAQEELKKWPYSWMTDEDYAAETRGSLKGTFSVKNGTVNTEVTNDFTVTDTVKGNSIGWAVLSDARSEYWALDNDYYIFYAPVWADGTFEIRNIIPGTYKLDINVNGIMDEYQQTNIVIGENENKDLGNVVWDDPIYGKTLWTLGTPDRTAEEYAYASPNYRYWGPHLLFNDLFPNGVDFKIGEDDESKDWFFVHMASQTSGDRLHYNGGFYFDEEAQKVKYDASKVTPLEEDDSRWKGNVPAEYKIRFDSDVAYGNGKATLLINVCGNRSGSIRATLNGTNIVDTESGVRINNGQMDHYGENLLTDLQAQLGDLYSEIVPDPEAVVTLYSDGSVMRSGLVGINQLVKITFDASLIKEGENVINLSHVLPSYQEDNTTSYKGLSIAGNIYDAIRLDVDAEPETNVSPNPSEKPETSSSPSPSETPGTSPSPNPSEKPETSSSPSPSETPGTSASPNPSEKPETSSSPNPSEIPGTSPSPTPDNAPGIEDGLEQTGKVVVEQTDTEIILKNDYCKVHIDKKSAQIKKYYTKEGNEICGENGGGGAFLLNYKDSAHNSEKKSKQELTVKNCEVCVVKNEDDYCEISLKEEKVQHADGINVLPINMDFRYVLTKDAPGLYMYAILEGNYSEEDIASGRTFSVEQSRYHIKFDYDSLPYSVVQGGELGGQLVKMPGPGDFQEDLPDVYDKNKRLMDSTWILNDGSIFTKYNNLSYQYCNTMVGAFGDDGGLALLTPSRDWAGGGYSKQDIDVHGGSANTFIVSWHLETAHNGTKNANVTEGYRKVYGPVMWYATTDPSIESKEDAYDMAYAQAQEELKKWPYSWMTDEDYAAETRGSLKGTFSVKNGTVNTEVTNDFTVTDAVKGNSIGWAVLSDARSEYWALDNDYYIFYAPVWADGTFEIRNIIPGTYKLDINVNGIMDEYQQTNIVIGENENKDLGNVVWDDPIYGKTLWTLGTPDRTAEEYAYASPNYRYWGSHLLFNDLFPNGVDFKIGEDDESRDWFFVHMASQTSGDKRHYSGALYFDEETKKVKYDASKAIPMEENDPRWRGNVPAEYKIRFDSDVTYGEGKATLLIDVCGNRTGSIKATLNGINIVDTESNVSINNGQIELSGGTLMTDLKAQLDKISESLYSEVVPNPEAVVELYSDGSVMRSGLVGINQLVKITFDASLIKEGENVITLAHIRPSYQEDNMTSYKGLSIAGNIYDAIRLDVDAEPSENINPTPTEEPGPSTNPTPTEEPGTSTDPAPTEEPGTSTDPAPTEEPGTSTDPAPTEEPGTSTDPAPTEEPGTSTDPIPTKEPGTEQTPELPADVQQKLEIENGISKVPPAFVNDENLNTPAKIETQMKLNIQKQVEGIALENIVVYDVVLMLNIGGSGWQLAGKESFPADGLIVTLPYPEGTGKDTHDFVVCHLFTEDMNEHHAGETEYPEVTKTEEGIQFKVYGLSPISVGWKQVIPVNEENGSGSQEGAVNEGQAAVPESPKTSDGNHIGWYIFIMILSVGLIGAICYRTYRREKR